MTDWSTLKKLIWLRIIKGGGSAARTVKGAIVHVINALARPAISVKCEVNPIQDLHGYDSPWPAGGGVNKLPNSLATSVSNNGVTMVSDGNGKYTLSGTATAQTVLRFSLVNSYVIPTSVEQGGNGVAYFNNSVSAPSVLAVLFYNGNTQVESWSLASINRSSSTYVAMAGKTIDGIGFQIPNGWSSGGTFSPMIVENGSTTAQFAPYSNICPISGRTSATVTRTGANVWDEEWELGSFNSQGQPSSSSTSIRCKNFIPVVSGQTYYMYSGSGKSNAPWMYGIDKSFIRRSSAYLVNQAFTIPEDVHYIKIALPGSYGTTYNHDISINYPATDTQYHPYQGDTYTIQLGDTIYGGTLDVTAGKMVVDNGYVEYDGSSDETWSRYGTGSASAYAMVIPQSNVLYKANALTIQANYLKSTTPSSTWGNLDQFISAQNGDRFITGIRTITTVADWTAYLAQNPLQVVYELATPLEITLTPTQIDMLLGENNVWADAGDLTLTYQEE